MWCQKNTDRNVTCQEMLPLSYSTHIDIIFFRKKLPLYDVQHHGSNFIVHIFNLRPVQHLKSAKKNNMTIRFHQQYLNSIFEFLDQGRCSLEWFQMYRHGFKSTSNSDKLLAHTVKINLAYILFKNIFDKMMRKAKNCKIHVQKRPNYIIKSNLKFGNIFLK